MFNQSATLRVTEKVIGGMHILVVHNKRSIIRRKSGPVTRSALIGVVHSNFGLHKNHLISETMCLLDVSRMKLRLSMQSPTVPAPQSTNFEKLRHASYFGVS